MKRRRIIERALAVIIILAVSLSPISSYVIIPGNTSVVMAATQSVGTEEKLREALLSSESSVKLTRDITGVSDTFKISKGEHTLDLNGHSIKGKFANSCAAITLSGGTLTIKDSSSKKSGLIQNTNSEGCGLFASNPDKKVKVEILDGKIKAASNALCITGKGNVTVDIKGGRFEGDTAVSLAGGTFTIWDGDFKAKYEAVAIQNMISKYKCKVTIKDGLFKGEDAVTMQHNPDVTISGGTFCGSSYDLWIYKSYCGKRKIDMSLFEKVYDISKEGLGVTENEFQYVDVEYEEGMEIDDADILFSVVESAAESLLDTVCFDTNEHFYNVLFFYLDAWNAGRTDKSNLICTVEDEVYHVTIKRSYSLEYQTQRVLEDSKISKVASDKAKSYAKQIRSILNKQTDSDMTKRQKAVAIHDYMVDKYSYDKDFRQESYHFYGLLKNKKGVCQGFATLYRLFMLAEGIECECISGMATSGPGKTDYEFHMWNRVKINKEWYYIDVTFDNGIKGKKFMLLKKDKFYGLGYHYPV